MERTSRRAWLSGLFRAAADGAATIVETSVERHLPPRRRPPGAIREALFLTQCTRCDACVEVCPHDAIYTYDPGTGLIAGTPVMRPDERPCHMCEGFPCASACPEGALEAPNAALWPLGKVRLALDRCLTSMGPECGACARICPEGVEAIVMAGVQPRLDETACVGCGRCVEACPTTPKAITLLPYEPTSLSSPSFPSADSDTCEPDRRGGFSSDE